MTNSDLDAMAYDYARAPYLGGGSDWRGNNAEVLIQQYDAAILHSIAVETVACFLEMAVKHGFAARDHEVREKDDLIAVKTLQLKMSAHHQGLLREEIAMLRKCLWEVHTLERSAKLRKIMEEALNGNNKLPRERKEKEV